ncbi:MAG TPA: UDP-N-acetylmuramate--L-alanine ligase [Candidatus Tidjanibacter gallistercoris]|nr:UDP-N-acetylmuramate--L-alanine ligase [Candidatus Tidjanibacter gallistercoris]
MKDTQTQNIYFLGIGGIGMSAVARYYLLEGAAVGGYDRTETALTRRLAEEGADIHYEDDPARIGERFRDPRQTLVVYTPALPHDHAEWAWFRNRGFRILKRSEILGLLAADKYVMAVAGTHGKTTTTTLTAWLNHVAGGGGSAFLGGISKNFDSNFVYGPGDRLAVEADEFDRSFLHLWPDAAVITSADADHLDIYGTHEELRRTFARFAGQIKPGGTLVIKKGVELPIENAGIRIYTYACDEAADFRAANPEVLPDGTYRFDIVCPDRTLSGCRLGIPGRVNVENAVAAVALLWTAGFDEARLREGLESFRGVRRRFDFRINTPERIYMDDYAHHPAELRAAIASVRGMFPGRRITAIFQPHLYTRTRDFYRGFAEALSLADEVLLVPIYPAREEPIEGVSSDMIGELLTVPHRTVPLERIASEAAESNPDILISFGAGSIENYTAAIAERLAGRTR